MGQPELVTSRLDDEEVIGTVRHSGDDAVVFTPTRSLFYEAEGLISDESITEYSHDVQTLAVRSGRRKAVIRFTYPIADDKQFSVPKKGLDEILHHLLAGILKVKGITGPGEAVRAVFRFNELTVVISSDRVITNVGDLVWDQDYDEYPYDDLTGISFEEGSVATQIVIYVDGHSQRIKAPNDTVAKVKQALQHAVFEYFDVETMAEFEAIVAPAATADQTGHAYDFDDGVEPLTSGGDHQEDSESVALSGSTWPYAEEAIEDEPETDIALEEALAELEAAMAAQERALDRQRAALEELTTAIRRGN